MNQNVFCKNCHRIPDQCRCNTAPRELNDEEIEVLKEIIRISDRKHPLWDKAKEFLK